MTETVDLAQTLEVMIARHGTSRDALLPLLHDLQAQRGFIGEGQSWRADNWPQSANDFRRVRHDTGLF